MGGRCYPEECEIEVVRQATDRGYSVFIVAIRLVFCCVSLLSLRLAQQSCLSRFYPISPKKAKHPGSRVISRFMVVLLSKRILY